MPSPILKSPRGPSTNCAKNPSNIDLPSTRTALCPIICICSLAVSPPPATCSISCAVSKAKPRVGTPSKPTVSCGKKSSTTISFAPAIAAAPLPPAASKTRSGGASARTHVSIPFRAPSRETGKISSLPNYFGAPHGNKLKRNRPAYGGRYRRNHIPRRNRKPHNEFISTAHPKPTPPVAAAAGGPTQNNPEPTIRHPDTQIRRPQAKKIRRENAADSEPRAIPKKFTPSAPSPQPPLPAPASPRHPPRPP